MESAVHDLGENAQLDVVMYKCCKGGFKAEFCMEEICLEPELNWKVLIIKEQVHVRIYPLCWLKSDQHKEQICSQICTEKCKVPFTTLEQMHS